MTTKTIFNMDTKLKKAAMKKARSEGTTLSSLLNFATRGYVSGSIKMTILDIRLQKAINDIEAGNFVTHEELVKRLKIKQDEKRNKVLTRS